MPSSMPVVGWRQKAFRSNAVLVTGELGVRMNSREIRPLPRTAILAVGDSFTAGSEVAEHETYPAQLEGLLGRPVVNGGVGGFGTDQMILWAYRLVPILNPSLLVVGVLDDDINRAGYKVLGGARKPWFSVSDGKLIHHNDPVPPPTQATDREPHWLGHSYLALWTASRFGRADLIRFRTSQNALAENEPVAATCAMLAGLKDFAAQRNLPVLIVMIYGGLDPHRHLGPRQGACAPCWRDPVRDRDRTRRARHMGRDGGHRSARHGRLPGAVCPARQSSTAT